MEREMVYMGKMVYMDTQRYRSIPTNHFWPNFLKTDKSALVKRLI